MVRSIFRQNHFFEYSGAFLLMGLLSLIFLTIDRNTELMKPLRQTVKEVLLEAYALVYGVNSTFAQGYTVLRESSTLLATVEKLTREREEFLVYNGLKLSHLERENKQLRDLLNMTDTYNEGTVVAEQVRSIAASNTGTLHINVGVENQVRLSQPVLSSKGLVGQINEVYDKFSQVLPIVHPSHALSVRVRDRAARFIAYGNGKDMVIPDLPAQADLHEGDAVVATGLGGIYPQFASVGEVTRIVQQERGSKDVYIRPYTDFQELRVVVVYQRRSGLYIP